MINPENRIVPIDQSDSTGICHFYVVQLGKYRQKFPPTPEI